MENINSLTASIRKVVHIVKKYQLQNARYRFILVDVMWNDNESTFELAVAIGGIKKNIVHFLPETILYDDALLSEFSPCDVRAITYLSLRRYLKSEQSPLVITNQYFRKGETFFEVIDRMTYATYTMSAKKLYQDHALLNRLSREHMINVVSTAVQEQTIKDLSE